ncbi:thermonuclease family protein [Psittacicella hinzii]|uniref:Uncharacterized protein n=1 Tax=Psittacicella hinzii TaxID=2028575 RepID=A0A3A1YSH1_9GAMM|nr:thermonuclease family protein [Psittacicella hinzii]RIY40446.1 hypothetical protein CKF58_00580 [Psittacicella hinzii]
MQKSPHDYIDDLPEDQLNPEQRMRRKMAAEYRKRTRRRQMVLYPLLMLVFAACVYYYDQQEQHKQQQGLTVSIGQQASQQTSTAEVNSTNSNQDQVANNTNNEQAKAETTNAQASHSQTNDNSQPTAKLEPAPVDYSKLPFFNIGELGEVGLEPNYMEYAPNANFVKVLPTCKVTKIISGNSFTCTYVPTGKSINVELLGIQVYTTNTNDSYAKTLGTFAQEKLQTMIDLDDQNHQVYLQVNAQTTENTYIATAYNILGANLNYTMLLNGYAFLESNLGLDSTWKQSFALAAAKAQDEKIGMYETSDWLNGQSVVPPQK